MFFKNILQNLCEPLCPPRLRGKKNPTMKKVLFIDRDGTLVIEPPIDFQLDSLEKLEFYPGVFQYLSRIAQELDYELVMVTNQDGLGTDSFPEETFWPAQHKICLLYTSRCV